MPRTGRPRLPVEQHRRRGTYRRDRHGPGPLAQPTRPVCGECGAPATHEVEDEQGTVWGPFCERHSNEACEILGLPTCP
jgi:hypothetical protein